LYQLPGTALDRTVIMMRKQMIELNIGVFVEELPTGMQVQAVAVCKL
jgi:hypothetical protein